MNITIRIEIVWLISNYENYGFGKDKILYNLIRGTKLKQVYNNGSIGYFLNGKFLSLKKLKPLLYKPVKQQTPF